MRFPLFVFVGGVPGVYPLNLHISCVHVCIDLLLEKGRRCWIVIGYVVDYPFAKIQRERAKVLRACFDLMCDGVAHKTCFSELSEQAMGTLAIYVS